MNPLKNFQRDNWFNVLVQTGDDKLLSDTNAPRLVILVRDDILPPLHQGIQAMHSVILLSQTVKIDPRCYLILLGATAEQINSYSEKIHKRYDLDYAVYLDPGLVDPETDEPPITACAFEPVTAEEVRLYFGGLTRAK